MPIMFSYNFTGAEGVHNNRMQSMFERLGWQNIGGSCYRYPALGAGAVWPEDWLNKVVPALMCFRSYVVKHGIVVAKFSIDTTASTGHDAGATPTVGAAPNAATLATLYSANNQQFGAANLVEWINAASASIPY